jgi:hypothetical protein
MFDASTVIDWTNMCGFTALKALILWSVSTSALFAPAVLEGIHSMPVDLDLSLWDTSFDVDPADFETIRAAIAASPIRIIVIYGQQFPTDDLEEDVPQFPTDALEVKFWKSVGKASVHVEIGEQSDESEPDDEESDEVAWYRK